VQLVLAEPPAVGQRIGGGRRHLLERLSRGEPLLGDEAPDLPAELRRQLAVVAGDQGAPVERQVAGRERVDGAADDVGDDQVAGIDRPMVSVSGEALGPRRQRQQRRVAGEVGGRARRRLGEPARAPGRQPGAGQTEGEDLVGGGVYGWMSAWSS
jgi:hypothetical protein